MTLAHLPHYLAFAVAVGILVGLAAVAVHSLLGRFDVALEVWNDDEEDDMTAPCSPRPWRVEDHGQGPGWAGTEPTDGWSQWVIVDATGKPVGYLGDDGDSKRDADAIVERVNRWGNIAGAKPL